MIVAIINQISPVGIVPVSSFVDAVDEAAGVTQYVNFFNPPLNPADWLGVNSGFVGSVPPSPPGLGWFWDFGTSTLVQRSAPGGLKPFFGFKKTLTLAPTVLVTVPTNDDVVYDLDVRVAARRVDVGKGFGKRMGVTIRRGTGPGSLVVIGSTNLYAHLEAPIAWTADVTPNLVTGNIEVIVVGAPASPVNWWGYVNAVEV
jgi:hypothetical protein